MNNHIPNNTTSSEVLTKRELIAAMALQGMLSNSNMHVLTDEKLARCCAYADALLEILNN